MVLEPVKMVREVRLTFNRMEQLVPASLIDEEVCIYSNKLT